MGKRREDCSLLLSVAAPYDGKWLPMEGLSGGAAPHFAFIVVAVDLGKIHTLWISVSRW